MIPIFARRWIGARIEFIRGVPLRSAVRPAVNGLGGVGEIASACEFLDRSVASALTHSDGSRICSSFLKIAGADVVQTNGLDAWLCAWM